MSEFKEEILRRRSQRRTKKSSSWLSVIAKILLLAFIIVMIRFMGKPSGRQLSPKQSNIILENKDQAD